jgi:serine/tyrosine/threonine adenylyltransferase
MNTDNMSILGLTIDYGPYGWLEGYDPGWTPNTTDAAGRRYCYGNQPQIGMWNLSRLAGALLPLVADRAALEQGLEAYRDEFQREYTALFAAKLGLDGLDRDGDTALFDGLFEVLGATEIDMTIFFRSLARVPLDANCGDEARLAPLQEAFYDANAVGGEAGMRLADWLRRYVERARADAGEPLTRRERMDRVNPLYVPRNYLAQQAIDAATVGDTSVLERLLDVLRRPYDERPGCESFAQRRPEWARHKPGCSALSCSS